MPFDIQYANPNSTRTIFSASTQMAYSSTSVKNNSGGAKTKHLTKNHMSSDKHTSSHKNSNNINNTTIDITPDINSRNTNKLHGSSKVSENNIHTNAKSQDISITKPISLQPNATPELISSIKSAEFSFKDSPELLFTKSPDHLLSNSPDLSNSVPSDYLKFNSPTVLQTPQYSNTEQSNTSKKNEIIESNFKTPFNIYMAVDNLSAEKAKKSATSKTLNLAERRNQLDEIDPLSILPSMNPYREINKKKNQEINTGVSKKSPFKKSATSKIPVISSPTDLTNILNDDAISRRINRNNINHRRNLRSTSSSRYTNSIFESLSLLDVYLGEKTPQQNHFLPVQDINQIYETSSAAIIKNKNSSTNIHSPTNFDSHQKEFLRLQQTTLDKHNKSWLKNELGGNVNANQMSFELKPENDSNSHRLQMQDILKFIDDDLSQLDENESNQGFKDSYLHINANKGDSMLNLRNSIAWSNPDTISLANGSEVESNIHEYSQESVEDRASIVTKSVISKVFSKKEIKQLSNIFNTMSNHSLSNDESFAEIREHSCISEDDENEEDSPIMTQENKFKSKKENHCKAEAGDEENINKLNENISAAIQELIIQTKQRELEELKDKYQEIEQEKAKTVRLQEDKILSLKQQNQKLEEVPELREGYSKIETEELLEEEDSDGSVVDDVDGLIFLEENSKEYSLMSNESRKNSKESCESIATHQAKNEKKFIKDQIDCVRDGVNASDFTNNNSVNSFNIVDLDRSNNNHHVNCTLTGSTAGKKNVYFTANPFLQNNTTKNDKNVNKVGNNSSPGTNSSLKTTSLSSSQSIPSAQSSFETNSISLTNDGIKNEMIMNAKGNGSDNGQSFESNNDLLLRSSGVGSGKDLHNKDMLPFSIETKLPFEKSSSADFKSQNQSDGMSKRAPDLTVDINSSNEKKNMHNTTNKLSNVENPQITKVSGKEDADSSLLDSFSQELAIVADELFSPLDATSPSFMNVFSPTGSIGSYHDFFSNDEDFLTDTKQDEESKKEIINLRHEDSLGLSKKIDNVYTIHPRVQIEPTSMGDIVSKNTKRLSLLDPESSACKEYLAKVAKKSLNPKVKQDEDHSTYTNSPLNDSRKFETSLNENSTKKEDTENSTQGGLRIEEILDSRLIDDGEHLSSLNNKDFADNEDETYYGTAALQDKSSQKKDFQDILIHNESMETNEYEKSNMLNQKRDSHDLEFNDIIEYEDITLHTSYCEDEEYEDDEDDEEYDYDITVSFDTSKLHVNPVSNNVRSVPDFSSSNRKRYNNNGLIKNEVNHKNVGICSAVGVLDKGKSESGLLQNQDDESTIVYCKEVYEQMYSSTPPASAGDADTSNLIADNNRRIHRANTKSIDTTIITEITPVDQVNSDDHAQLYNKTLEKCKDVTYNVLMNSEGQTVPNITGGSMLNAETAKNQDKYVRNSQNLHADAKILMNNSNVPLQSSRIMRKIRKIRRKLIISSSDITLLRESWASIMMANHNSNNVNHDAHRSIYSSLENPLLSSHIQEDYFSAYSFTKQFYNNLFREVAFIRNRIFPSGSLKKQIIAFGNILMEGIKSLNNLFKIKKFLFLNNYINHENNVTSKFCSKTIYGYSKFNIEKSNRYFSIFAKIFFRTLNENLPGDFNKQLKFCWTKFYKFLFSCIVGGLSEKEISRIKDTDQSESETLDPGSHIFQQKIESSYDTKSGSTAPKQEKEEQDSSLKDSNIVQSTYLDPSEVKNEEDIPEVVPCAIVSDLDLHQKAQESQNVPALVLDDENVSSSSSSSSGNKQQLAEKTLISPKKPIKQVRFTEDTEIKEPDIQSNGLSSEDINLLTKLKMVKDSLLLRSKLFMKRKPSNQGYEDDLNPPMVVTSHGVNFTLASPTTSAINF